MRNLIMILFVLEVAGCNAVMKTAGVPSGSVTPTEPGRSGQFPMPDLSGQTRSEAEATLVAAGKTGGVDVKETDCGDEAVKEGTVCGQTPEPGQTTSAGTPTVIYLQSKRNPKMPDVIGRLPDEAKRILAEAGFHQVEVKTLDTPRRGCVRRRGC
jgi:beta-lactam-binding protein with PASTA domain